jgi:hypothetical protein
VDFNKAANRSNVGIVANGHRHVGVWWNVDSFTMHGDYGFASQRSVCVASTTVFENQGIRRWYSNLKSR